MTKWLLPLMLLGLVGCASETFVGKWEGMTTDGDRVLLDVNKNGAWAAETISEDADPWKVSGKWVLTGTGQATFTQPGEEETQVQLGQAVLMDPKRMILRSDSGEIHFQRR